MKAAIKYSYVNAKTRTMHSKRLRPSEWHVLENLKDRQGLLHYLATTSYGPWVAPLLQQSRGHEELFDTKIFGALFNDYHKILHSLSSQTSREVILAFFSRFEGENLKIVLRAIYSGLKKIDVAHLLYPVKEISKIDWDGLWRQKDVKGAVKLLETTQFGPMLHHALAQFEAQGRLFPLEMAIDISCYKRISEGMEAVKDNTDRRQVRQLLGSYIDALNICHIVRLRLIYGLSPEEALNYSYSGGNELNLQRLHAIAKADSLASVTKLLPDPLKTKVQSLDLRHISSLRLALEEWVIEKIRKAFLGNPFHLGVQVAHLLEKELEIRALIRLYQAKLQAPGKPAREIVPSIFLKGGEQIVQAS